MKTILVTKTTKQFRHSEARWVAHKKIIFSYGLASRNNRNTCRLWFSTDDIVRESNDRSMTRKTRTLAISLMLMNWPPPHKWNYDQLQNQMPPKGVSNISKSSERATKYRKAYTNSYVKRNLYYRLINFVNIFRSTREYERMRSNEKLFFLQCTANTPKSIATVFKNHTEWLKATCAETNFQDLLNGTAEPLTHTHTYTE